MGLASHPFHPIGQGDPLLDCPVNWIASFQEVSTITGGSPTWIRVSRAPSVGGVGAERMDGKVDGGDRELGFVDELLDWLEDQFPGFGRRSFIWAMERAQPS